LIFACVLYQSDPLVSSFDLYSACFTSFFGLMLDLT
jgi:hypothetical protein